MKTVIEMAREAGFNLEQGFLLRVTGIDEDLERFVELVRADERASIAKEWDHCLFGDLENIDIGAAIRARSNT